MFMWLPWYLLLGLVIGVMVALAYKKVINGEKGRGIFYGSAKDVWHDMPPGVRIQFEIHQEAALVGIVVLTTLVWLPCFLCEIPTFFKAFFKRLNGRSEDEE